MAQGPLDYRFGFWGGLFSAEVDSGIRWDSTIVPGTDIGFESTLDMDDNDTSFNGAFEWRFFPRHEFSLRYFKLKRSGLSDSPINLVINGNTIPIDTEVSSYFDSEVLAAHYAFALVRKDNLRLDLGLGLSIQDLKFGLIASDVDFEERGDVTAPLPTLNLGLDWAITPRWIAGAHVGWFDLKVNNIKGEVREARASIKWKPWENVGFDLAYNYFEVRGKVTEEEGRFEGRLKYEFKGPLLGLHLTF